MAELQLNLDAIIQSLKLSHLFQDESDEVLYAIAERMDLVTYAKGDPIVLEHETSDHVYIVHRGSVEVIKHLLEVNQVQRVAVLGPGNQFSEFSVLNKGHKGASVFAIEDSELLRLDGGVFLEILRAQPAIARRLLLQLGQMTQQSQSASGRFDYVRADEFQVHYKIAETYPPKLWTKFMALPVRLEGRSLFVAMRDPQNAEFFDFMAKSQPNLQFHVSLINEDDFQTALKALGKAYTGPQLAQTPSAVSIPDPLPRDPNEWIPRVSLFSEAPHEWLPQLSAHVEYLQIKRGDYLFRAGEVSDRLYIVHSGLFEVFRPLSRAQSSVFTGNVGPGDYLAEVSLLTGQPHSLSVRALSDSVVATFTKEDFSKLIEMPQFTIPMARELISKFQKSTRMQKVRYFDASKGVQCVELSYLIPKSVMAQYEILPLRLSGDQLTLGSTNPDMETNLAVITRYVQKYRFHVELIKSEQFKTWFAQVDQTVEGAATTVGRKGTHNLVTGDSVQVLDRILQYAIEHRASDIHFEPQEQKFVVRYRIDGVLRESPEKYSKELGVEVISRVKVLSELDTTNRFTPQDGQMKFDEKIGEAFGRVSTLPSKHGETLVMRVVRSRNSVPPLSTLVPDRRVIRTLNEVAKCKQGVFLVTGPTGSGKSTTMYSLLQQLNEVGVSIVSIEDPVELEIPGTTQIEINEKQGLTFSAALKSALRQDPNVIFIGEIRDEESARIAFHAASTGHLVISTLHTMDSVNVLPRLEELGVSRGAMASTLIGASAQRLVRQICRSCDEVRPATEAEQEIFRVFGKQQSPPEQLHFGRGCSHCGGSGYQGRLPVVELWTKNKMVENAILSGAPYEEIQSQLKGYGFESLYQFGLKMAASGFTSLEEVNRVLGGALLIESKPLKAAA
jgi:type II secretory ATPase GspE/PulE/Tfp pilus assembly ATPase PilB-like protein